jgi:plastocyanin domain-containing protein
MRSLVTATSLAIVLIFAPISAGAQNLTLTIKDHKFTPSEIKVPANKRVQLTIINDDPTPEEFESTEMKAEKVIPGKTKAVVRIGPLKPGRYSFVGEFHEDTAKGTVIAE